VEHLRPPSGFPRRGKRSKHKASLFIVKNEFENFKMEKIKNIIQASINVKRLVLDDDELIHVIHETVQVITNAFKNGNHVYFCGNGGSAADAQHLAAEFSGRFYTDRKALPAEALHCNTSYLTAVANDYSYDVIYSRLIDGIGKQGDVLIGLSTSGNSGNIVKAFETAKQKEIITIGMTGSTGGKMKELSDFLINIPSTDTPRIQESHILVGHIICELVEKNYFG
jgi:D-sedoheptulose 7-phosphate isomerase